MLNRRFFFITTFLCMLIDQITKMAVNSNMASPVQIIPNVLSFDKIYNTGAAFSIFQNNITFLILITLITLTCILYMVLKKNLSYAEIIALGFISGGAFGNLIDRASLGYVIDFIRLDFINFPVFNFADIFINIGVIILIGSMLLIKNDE